MARQRAQESRQQVLEPGVAGTMVDWKLRLAAKVLKDWMKRSAVRPSRNRSMAPGAAFGARRQAKTVPFLPEQRADA